MKHNTDQPTALAFARKQLKLTSWRSFDEIFKAVDAGHRRILVRSANGVGKTTALAALCNWKLSTSNECIVLTTSSSEQQLRHNLWGEIRRQASRAALYDPKVVTDTRIKLDDKKFMVAVSPAKPESAQGYHAASILIAIDEATGVRRDIISSLLATATGADVLIVMIYNPMTTNSYVYEAELSGEWKVITLNALKHPNVTRKRTIIPGAVTWRNICDRLSLWSEEAAAKKSDTFKFEKKWWRKTLEISRRILGEWPLDDAEGIIARTLVTTALTVEERRGVKTMGVDLAAGGTDETVIARFDGNVQLPFITLRTSDMHEIADAIEREYRNGFSVVAIDETGAVSSLSPLLALRGVGVHPVKFGEGALGVHDTTHRKLANKRIEMYYNLLSELREGKIKLLADEKLAIELTNVRLSAESERELYYLEKKEKVRQRIGRSPDRADATVLARYAPVLEARGKKMMVQF
jgi:hypothetical protein